MLMSISSKCDVEVRNSHESQSLIYQGSKKKKNYLV